MSHDERDNIRDARINHEHDVMTNNKGESVHTDRTYFTSKAGAKQTYKPFAARSNYILLYCVCQ